MKARELLKAAARALKPFSERVESDGVNAPYPEETWSPQLIAAKECHDAITAAFAAESDGLPLDVLIEGVGLDKVEIEMVHERLTGATALSKRKAGISGVTQITLHTLCFTPNDAMALATNGAYIRKLGMLIWMPNDDVQRVKRERGIV